MFVLEGKTMIEKKCKYCGNNEIRTDNIRGIVYCTKCGAILEENEIDSHAEWRSFSSEQQSSRTRTGAPITFTKHNKGISTEIGKGNTEMYKLNSKKRNQYYRLRKWNKRIMNSKERNLSYSLAELERQVSYLMLPKSIHEEVARLYEKAVKKGVVRGRSIESIITALIYAVARSYGVPRTISELSAASGIEKREIGRAYRYISRQLSLKILPATSKQYIPRFVSLLGLDGKVEARAKEIVEKTKDSKIISGKGPTGVAAAAIYIAAVLEGRKQTQRDIADIVGVTEVTIRNRYKDLIKALGIEDQMEKISNEEEKNEDEDEDFPRKRKRKKIISKFKTSQLIQKTPVEDNSYSDKKNEE